MGGNLYLEKFMCFVPKIIWLFQIWMACTNLDHDEKLKA
jgi:hypothetical protein